MLKDSQITEQDMKEIYKKIGENVKRVRKEKGISQLNLALAIGHKAVGVISNCELCLQNKHFNIEHLVKISEVLDVDINIFFKDIRK